MEINWQITEADKNLVRTLIEKQRETKIVRDRYERNLAPTKPDVTTERFWRAMVCMRLTTLADSGPNTNLSKFQSETEFPLSCNALRAQDDRYEFIHNTLRTRKVGTHPNVISDQLAENFRRLENGEWRRALTECNRLTSLAERKTEAEVAEYIRETFKGFGPKQSRNVLQALGLTRYEIPIDSRVTNWLNVDLKFPLHVRSSGLADPSCYNFILDAICELAEKSETFPCILDAAIFTKDDPDAWSVEALRY